MGPPPGLVQGTATRAVCPLPPPAQGAQPPGAALPVPGPVAAQGRRHSGAFSSPGTVRAASRGAKGPFVASWVLLQRAGAGAARPGGSPWGRSPSPAATVPPRVAKPGHEQHVGSVKRALGQIPELIPSEHGQLGTTEPPSAGAASWRTPPCSLGTLPEGRGSARRGAGGCLARPPCPQAPQALSREICIPNGSVVPELPAARGQARSRSCCLRPEPLGGCGGGEGSARGDV